jgi:hypothetical protein
MKFDTDKIIGLSAMVIGLASLGVVYYQAQLQRDQMELERRATAASVMPYLTTNLSRADVGAAFNLRNTGIGPARIEGVRILHKGSVFDGDAVDFYLKMRTDSSQGYNSDPVQVGRLVPAGEWVQMLGSGGDLPTRNAMAVEILRLFDIAEARAAYPELKLFKPDIVLEGAVLEITYSSVFGDRWVMRSDNMVPQPQ